VKNSPQIAETHDLPQSPPLERNWFAAIRAVTGFQLNRLMTRPRLAMGLVGALFPAAVMFAVIRTAPINRDMTVAMIYVLIPEALCVLGLLVTMCPVVADELERGTWIHVTVRPGGRQSLLLGTFAAAVIWTGSVSLVALMLTLLIAQPTQPIGLVVMFTVLIGISCVGRASLFALPAVILPKRALIASVGVALVVEYFAGLLPAVVNQVTVSLRLRSLLVEWMEWREDLPIEMTLFVDDYSAPIQLVAVCILVFILLTTAGFILNRRQFPPSAEN
jgi:ABC-type transport system involved in multi-copper enzyme maturation permease subunit